MDRPDGLPEFDSRPSIRITNTMPEHKKIAGLSDSAFRLWIEVMCWCSRQEEDGKIPRAVVARMATTKKAPSELEAVALLKPTGDSYDVHDYLAHQRSAFEIQSFRDARSESGAKGAHMRWHVPARRRVKDCAFCQEMASA